VIRRVLAAGLAVLCLTAGLVAGADVASAQYAPGACVIIVDPTSVSAGETVQITAQGFPPGQTVTFTVAGIPIASVTASNDVAGQVTTSATIPADLPEGTYTIEAQCGNQLATASVNVSSAASNAGAGNRSAGSGSTSGSLAGTGADPMPFVKAGLLLLACGGLILLAVRKREPVRR
jgi:antitoxin (DNA-binding transcriptional repressor) of toxin-antitoxin stability system